MLVRAIGFIAGVFFAATAYAGAWVLPEGRGLVIQQATYYSTDRYFDAKGAQKSQPRFTKRALHPYVEYGLTEGYTIGGSLSADSVEQSDQINSGIADPELFMRTRLWSDARQVLSLQPLIKFPSYYAIKAPPRTGSNSTDAEISLLYGRNQPLFEPEDYTDLRIGYRLRNRGLADQLRLDAAFGIKWTSSLELVPAIRSIIAIAPRTAPTYSEDGEQDYSLIKTELKTLYHLDELQWVEGGISKAIGGFQTGAGYGLTFAYARRF